MGLAFYQRLAFYQPVSDAVVHFGDNPADCVARVVGHDQTLLFERPSEVAPLAPAIQADFRTSGDRMMDKDQQERRLYLIGCCGNIILQASSQRRH